MKKLYLILILFFLSNIAFSQSGIGLRGIFGYSAGVYGGAALSYQNVGKFEINGAWNERGYGLAGLKLWNLVEGGMLNVYTGAGAGASFNKQLSQSQGVLMADIGVGISFGPVMLTMDMRPEYEIISQDSEPWRFNFGFAIRAMFPDRD